MDKRKAALAALEHHARRYKVAIPDRLRAFYAGDFEKFHLRYVRAKVGSWGDTTFQLALTPPTWLNKGDDAINGPRGEWQDAGNHVPLFVTDAGLCVTVNLSAPGCPTGWYHEEEDGAEGPERGAISLDAFLAELMTQPPATNGVNRPDDPDQALDWREDFSDHGPRTFDLSIE